MDAGCILFLLKLGFEISRSNKNIINSNRYKNAGYANIEEY